MKAVAYTEAVQTIVLVIGSALVTIFGLHALGAGRSCGPSSRATCSTSETLVPAARGTWAPVSNARQMAWYFNDNYPGWGC